MVSRRMSEAVTSQRRIYIASKPIFRGDVGSTSLQRHSPRVETWKVYISEFARRLSTVIRQSKITISTLQYVCIKISLS